MKRTPLSKKLKVVLSEKKLNKTGQKHRFFPTIKTDTPFSAYSEYDYGYG